MSEDQPLERLCGLAHARLSGEFICVAPALEVHVYLREGRIAWGADARETISLAAHLQQTANIDPQTLHNVVEECRRDKRSLVETLVSWGLATRQQVRESLRMQIAPALSRLSKTAAARTVFLERAYDPYDRELTFDLDDLLENSVIARAREGALALSLRPLLATGFAEHLLESIEGAAWIEILGGERVLDGAPNLELPRTCLEFLRRTLLDGADFVAVRSADGSIIGLPLRVGQRSLWCKLEADSTFGAALSTLGSFALGGARTLPRAPRAQPADEWSAGGPRGAPELESLAAFRRRAPEVSACVVLRAGEATSGCGSSALSADEAFAIARRRALSLAAYRTWDPGGSARSIVTGDSGLWCCGVELASDPAGEETLWIFLDRRSSQGLGWAYLSALARTLRAASREAIS